VPVLEPNPRLDTSASAAESTRSVSFRHLRYFLGVYEDLHFGRAAYRLQIAQPALSRAIRRLENTLGVTLFERSSRAVAPTAAGDVFAEETRKTLAAFDHAVAEARAVDRALPTVRVGYVPYLSVDVLTRFLAALKERLPDVRATVANLPSLEQVQRLRRGELDFAIFPNGVRHDGLELEPLSSGDPLAAFLVREHPLAAKGVLTPADLARESIVVFPRSLNPIGLELWLTDVREAGYGFAGIVEAGGATVRDLFLAVRDSNGILLGPSWYEQDVALDALALAVRPLDPPLKMWHTVVAWATEPGDRLAVLLPAVRAAAAKVSAGS
jgi:DNA-binding transcriptional LysR family regulator